MVRIGSSPGTAGARFRMLRHYDAIGRLRPASVDPDSGCRFYPASQFAALNRIIALNDLGFTLQRVKAILAKQVSAAGIRARPSRGGSTLGYRRAGYAREVTLERSADPEQ